MSHPPLDGRSARTALVAALLAAALTWLLVTTFDPLGSDARRADTAASAQIRAQLVVECSNDPELRFFEESADLARALAETGVARTDGGIELRIAAAAELEAAVADIRQRRDALCEALGVPTQPRE